MAMTKRLHVTLDVKFVFANEEVETMTKELVEYSRKFLAGEPLTKLELELARLAAQYGPEAAVDLWMKSQMQEFLRTELRDAGASTGNIRVEVKR